jgi:hypothetical protein
MNSIVLAASDELRVVFDYRVARWGHTIEVRREDEWIIAYSSIEGTSSDDWPPSPAFQHIHLQNFSLNGPTALLVGKAGSSHWSAAIEADREAGALRFDIACRMSAEPTRLGSAYSSLHKHLPASTKPLIELATLNDTVHRVLDSSDTVFSVRVSNEFYPKPSTIRWKYAISLS